MKKAPSIACSILGLLLVTGGTAGLFLFTSDGMLRAAETRIDLGKGTAVVSAPGLIGYRDADLVVRASSSTGSVFLGVAHPIDVLDYVADASFASVIRQDRGGLHSELVTQSTPKDLPAPQEQTFWAAKAIGAGEQHLRVPLDGTPVAYVVVPEKKGGTVTLSAGTAVSGIRQAALGTLTAGAILLALGALALVRLRPRGLDRAPLAGAQEAAGEVAAADARISDPAPGTAPTASGPALSDTASGTARRAGARVARFALVLSLATVLTGCVTLPKAMPAVPSAGLAKTALAPDQVDSLLTRYDELNNAAIEETSRTRKPKAWTLVDGGALLEADLWSTRVGAARKSPVSTVRLTHSGKGLYAGAFTAYPMTVIIPVTVSVDDGSQKSKAPTDTATPKPDAASKDAPRPDSSSEAAASRAATSPDSSKPEPSKPDPSKPGAAKADPANVSYTVWRRSRATEPWLQIAHAMSESPDTLRAAAPGPASTPGAADLERGLAAASELGDAITSGSKKGVDLGPAQAVRKDLLAPQDIATATLDVRLHGDAEVGTDPDGPVVVVRTPEGLLVMATYHIYVTYTTKTPGGTLSWNAPLDAVRGSPAPSLIAKSIITAAVHLPTDGPVRIIAASLDEVG